MWYEELISEAQESGIEVIEMSFKGSLKGLYSQNTIAINSKLETNKEKTCILAEELGHHYTSSGNILSISEISCIKQEKIARNWGYEKLVGIIDIINVSKKGMKNRHDMAEQLNVTEEFLDASIQHYREKYGLYCEIDHYIVYFDPLRVLEIFQEKMKLEQIASCLEAPQDALKQLVEKGGGTNDNQNKYRS